MTIYPSVCPLDCPAACSLDIRLDDGGKVKSISGNKEHPFTKGVICKKVKNFDSRLDSPYRLTKPLKRVGAKGIGAGGGNHFVEISLDEALDILSQRFKETIEQYGAESIWPFYYAGTMGWCQRDGINRLNHRFGFSQMKGTYCISVGNAGFKAGVGAALGVDPLECFDAKQIIIWGQNTQVTQLPLMAHFLKARAENNSKIIVIDVYETPTMKLADKGYIIKPGSDGALAMGMMNIILEQGLHDIEYLKKYSDFEQINPKIFQEWTLAKTANATGLSKQDIMELTLNYANEPQSLLRLGYGLTRRRGGAVNLHAISCLPVMLGHYKHKGGGALWSLSGHFSHLDKSEFSGSSLGDTGRVLDQSAIGKILAGDKKALKNGGEVKAMLIQNTNPVNVAAHTELVRKGLLREDLFTCVHELFMTDTAKYADLIIPATGFIEHDDIYSQGGWHWLHIAPKIRDGLGDSIENHELVNHLARSLGANDESFQRSAKEQIQTFLSRNNLGDFDDIVKKRGIDFALSFDDAHFLNGYPTGDKKFHFAPNWQQQGDSYQELKAQPDAPLNHSDIQKEPFGLIIPPREEFLNSTFSENYQNLKKGKLQPIAMLSRQTLSKKESELTQGLIVLSNHQGKVELPFELNDKIAEDLIVIEGIFPRSAYKKGYPNDLMYDASALPNDGLCVHDIAVDFLIKPL
ncbi:MAG: molybdopterin-dependent oxidoreductase [Alphaproteobacteria bacterium]